MLTQPFTWLTGSVLCILFCSSVATCILFSFFLFELYWRVLPPGSQVQVEYFAFFSLLCNSNPYLTSVTGLSKDSRPLIYIPIPTLTSIVSQWNFTSLFKCSFYFFFPLQVKQLTKEKRRKTTVHPSTSCVYFNRKRFFSFFFSLSLSLSLEIYVDNFITNLIQSLGKVLKGTKK